MAKKKAKSKSAKTETKKYSATKTKSLFGAIYDNDRKKIKSLLQGGADPNAIYKGSTKYSPSRPINGQTPLLFAIALGYEGVITELVQGGADINQPGGNKYRSTTPLFSACGVFALGLAKKIVKLGADPEHPIGLAKQTALHLAAQGDNAFQVEDLLKLGADPVARDAKGKTPQQLAEAKGQAELVGILSKYAAKAKPKKVTAPTKGSTARKKSVSKSKAQFQGEMISAITENKIKIVERLLADGADPNMTLPGKSSPLLLAVQHIQKGIAARLIAAGAKPRGAILMHSLGDAVWTKMLLDAGADPNKEFEERTPLERAVEFDGEKVVKLLLQAGARLRNKKQPDEIERARVRGDARVVKMLEQHFEINTAPKLSGPKPLQDAVLTTLDLTGGVVQTITKKPLVYVVSVDPKRFLPAAEAKRTTAVEKATKLAFRKLDGKLGSCVAYCYLDVSRPGVVLTMPEDKFSMLRMFKKLQKWLIACDRQIGLTPVEVTTWSYTYQFKPASKIPKKTQDAWIESFPDEDKKLRITASRLKIQLIDDAS